MWLQSDIRHLFQCKICLCPLLPTPWGRIKFYMYMNSNLIKAEMTTLLPFPGQGPPFSRSTHKGLHWLLLPVGACLHARAPRGVAGGRRNALASLAHAICHRPGGTLDGFWTSPQEWQQSQDSCSGCDSRQLQVSQRTRTKKKSWNSLLSPVQ